MSARKLPDLPSVPEIGKRLVEIFPEGTPNRKFCIREMTAKTVFVMLYIGAIEGEDVWIRPDQVTRMTDKQATKSGQKARASWADDSLQKRTERPQDTWYAPNTREPIRDETIRNGLLLVGAVIEREGLPTTSPSPRYALQSDFADLFIPDLSGEALLNAIQEWRDSHLTSAALTRTRILKATRGDRSDQIGISLPRGGRVELDPGPSSVIAKAVIEVFTSRFLENPVLLLLSESRVKVIAEHQALMDRIGLAIHADKTLPDIILADLGSDSSNSLLLVFVEVVATSGHITEARKDDILAVLENSGIDSADVAFITAFLDRNETVFKQAIESLAWNTFAWFVSEPDGLIHLYTDSTRSAKLRTLMHKPIIVKSPKQSP